MEKLELMLAAIAVIAAMAAPGAAQDRMPPIPAEQLTAAQKTAIAEFKAARGVDISGPFVPMLRSPEVMSRARAMGDYLRFKSSLPPRLSEFVILLTARRWTQQYEWQAHLPHAMKAGLKPEIAQAVAEGRRPTGMAADEELVYELITESLHNKSVCDATYARAVAKFGESGVVDLVGLAGYYLMLAMVMNLARTAMPDGREPLLAPFPC